MKIYLNQAETGHVGLNVTDLDRSERFYRKIFGFGVQLESSDHGGKYAFLTNGGRLMLTLSEQLILVNRPKICVATLSRELSKGK